MRIMKKIVDPRKKGTKERLTALDFESSLNIILVFCLNDRGFGIGRKSLVSVRRGSCELMNGALHSNTFHERIKSITRAPWTTVMNACTL